MIPGDNLTHHIRVVVTGDYPHGQKREHSSVEVAGDGSLDHVIDTFQAALVAMGYAPDTAAKLTIAGGD